MPVSVGRLVTSSVKASMPPAEAPTAAINKSFLCSERAESSSLEELRELRPGDFGFIYFFPSRRNERICIRQECRASCTTVLPENDSVHQLMPGYGRQDDCFPDSSLSGDG